MSYYHLTDGTTNDTVVFINGLFGSFESAQGLIESLGKYRQLHIDPYAYLESKQDKVFALEEFTVDIAQLIEELESPRTILIGSDLGALVCKRLTLLRPDLVEGEVLMGMSGKPLGKTLINSLFQIIEFLEKGTRNKTSVEKIARLFLGRYAKDGVSTGYKGLTSNSFHFERLRLLFKEAYCHEPFSDQELAEQKVPNLLIANKLDSIVHLSDTERFANRIGTNRGMKVLPNAHNHVEAIYDEELIEHVTTFVDSVIITPSKASSLMESLRLNWIKRFNDIPDEIVFERHSNITYKTRLEVL